MQTEVPEALGDLKRPRCPQQEKEGLKITYFRPGRVAHFLASVKSLSSNPSTAPRQNPKILTSTIISVLSEMGIWYACFGADKAR
jgi:hypothetical protein